MGILSAPQDPDEMRYWREQASPFRFIYDAARARDAELSASGRKPTLGGLMSKEAGDYGLSTNEWEVDNNLGGVLAGLLSPVLKAFDAPSSAYQNLIPEEDLIPEVMGTAGLAMGGGAAIPSPSGSLRSGSLRSEIELPPAKNAAEQIAKDILEVRAAGGAENITNEMMAKADPQYMFDNTPLAMDTASRLARASEQEYAGDYYSGSNAAFSSFNEATWPDTDKGVFASNAPSVADSYVDKAESIFSAETPTIYPLMVRGGADFPVVDAKGNFFTHIPSSGLPDELEMLGNSVGRKLETDEIAEYLAKKEFDGQGNLISRPPGVIFQDLVDPGRMRFKKYEGETDAMAQERIKDAARPSDVINVSDRSRLRSKFARFDPEFAHLSDLMAANKSASGGLLSAATANELSSPNLQMLPGILSSVDQRIAASTPKSWLDPKFDQPQWHPISGVSQKIPASDVKPIFEDLGLLSPERQMKIEDLAGRPITPAFGDRTIAGVNILGVDDTVFDSPVRSQGGRDFMREEGTGLWASEKKPMTEKSEIVNQLIEAGEDPALIYTAMGAQSGDFSKIMMKTALNQFDPIKISNDAAKSFDERMAKLGIKNWPGTKSGKVEEALDEMTGTSRWAIWQEMDKAKYRDAGFPDINLARIAITDPKLLNVDPFTSGLNVGRPTGLLTNDQFIKHPSYEYQIGGDYEGGLGNLPGQIIWRDFFENRRKINSPVGSDQRSFMMSSPQMVSRVDDQMVEEVNAWLERQRRGQ